MLDGEGEAVANSAFGRTPSAVVRMTMLEQPVSCVVCGKQQKDSKAKVEQIRLTLPTLPDRA